MTAKDFLLQAGVVVTLVLGLVNLYLNLQSAKRTSFINTVTSERIKWIAKVRENISILCAMCSQWVLHPSHGNMPDRLHDIEAKKHEVRLQLNPADPEDQDIARLVASLPSWSQALGPVEYMVLEAQLVKATQVMLKREWDKVKAEAAHGDLRPFNQRRG